MVKCEQSDSSVQLPKFDRLKFIAYWDDRAARGGDIHDLTVYYHLIDDTIQIYEVPQQGRPFVFFNRAKLTKKTGDVLKVQQKPSPELIGYLTMSTVRIKDRRGATDSSVDFYTDGDLRIGQTLNVFGRKVVLIDCDEYTRQFYQKVYGIEDFSPIKRPEQTDPIQSSGDGVRHQIHTFGACGSNHLSMEVKLQQQHKAKSVMDDKCKLRFKATAGNDEKGQFIITYHLEDDTISVFDLGNNTPASSGELLKRSRFFLPHSNVFPTDSIPYSSEMFFIGATVDFNRNTFNIIDADDFTLNFMESHELEYPKANIELIVNKIKAAIEPIYNQFVEKYSKLLEVCGEAPCWGLNVLDCETMAAAIRELLGKDITEHEIVTFLRFFSPGKRRPLKKPGASARSKVHSTIKLVLSNCYWDDIEGIERRFNAVDAFMPPDKVRTLLRITRIPIKGRLVDEMFSVLNKDEDGNIDTNDLLNFLGGRSNEITPIPVRKVLPNDPYSGSEEGTFHARVRPKFIEWDAFLSALDIQNK